MNPILKELEKELFEYNDPEALFIPADLLELVESPPDSFCYWDLSEEERDELFYPMGCQCKKCFEKELEWNIDYGRFDLNEIYNSAFIN